MPHRKLPDFYQLIPCLSSFYYPKPAASFIFVCGWRIILMDKTDLLPTANVQFYEFICSGKNYPYRILIAFNILESLLLLDFLFSFAACLKQVFEPQRASMVLVQKIGQHRQFQKGMGFGFDEMLKQNTC
jgi:hypothetical protein